MREENSVFETYQLKQQWCAGIHVWKRKQMRTLDAECWCLKCIFFPLLCVSLRYIQNYIAVNNRGKSDMFVVTASMLLWRYELKWIYSCGMYIQCTWKLRKFVWRTDRRRRLLWRNVTCLKLPDKVLASTVAVCKTFQHICVYWNVRRIGLWNTARKVTCIVVMKIVIRELTSKVTAYVVSSRGAIQHHILAFPPITMARGLRRGSAVARLLGLRIWIPPDAWMSCLLWVLFVVKYWSLRRVDLSSRGVLPSVVCLSVKESSTLRRSSATRAVAPWEKRNLETSSFPEHNVIILMNRCQKSCMQILHIYGGKYRVPKYGR